MSDEGKSFPVADRYPELRGHFHEGDIRVGLAVMLFVLASCVFGFKLHFASEAGFKECAVDQFFDPLLSGLVAALTTVIGFYFGDRRRG